MDTIVTYDSMPLASFRKEDYELLYDRLVAIT